MGQALTFDDIAPPQSGAVQPPPPQVGYAPNAAAFTDTGQSGTQGQVTTYRQLAQTGGYDPSQPPGSIRNPFGVREGASIPAGAWFVDQSGSVKQAPAGGVQIPPQQTPQAPQRTTAGGQATQGGAGAPADSGGTQRAAPPTDAGGAIKFDDLAPPASFGGDVINSVPTGLVHAATGVLGAAGNIGDLTDKGVQMAANSVRGLFGQKPITLPHHNPLGPDIPDSSDLNHAVEGVTGPLYQPQTWGGRAVDTALSFAPAAALGPEGIGLKALSVAAPAAASDVAGEVARAYAPQWEGAARLAGGLAGGLGVGAGMAAPGSAKVIASGARGLTDADISAAQTLRQNAAGLGVPITVPEAVAGATGKGYGLLQAQRAVEGTQAGGDVMGPYMAARPGQMQGAVDGFVRQVAPNGAPPSVVGPQASTAAEGALTAERQAINARAEPYYTASRGDLIDPASYSALHVDPVYQSALQALRDHPELGPTVADLPDNAVGTVDLVGRRLQTAADQARGSEVMPGDMQLAGIRQATANRAFQVAGASSPTYAAARQIVAQGHAATLNPLTASPLGAISKTQSLADQTGALFPSAPFPGAPAETTETLSRMGSIDPTAPGSLVGAHLGRAAAEAFSDTRNGSNLYGGSKFALDVAGNPLQRQNLQAGATVAAGPQVGSQIDPLIEAMMATGRRLPPRQATPQEIGAALQAHSINAGELGVSMGVPAEAAHSPLGLVTYPALKMATKGMEGLNNMRAAGNASALGNAFISPADIGAVIGGARDQVANAAAARNAALAAALLGNDQPQR